MREIYKTPFVLGLAMLLGAQPAWAHVGHGAQAGFMHGLAHFFSGLDHLAYMGIAGLLAGFATRSFRSSAVALSVFVIGFAFIHDVTLLGKTGLQGFDFGFMSGAMALIAFSFAVAKFIKPTILRQWRFRREH